MMQHHTSYWKLFIISFIVVLLTGTTSVVLRLYTQYIYFASQAIPDTNYQKYINNYKKSEEFVDQTLNLSNYQQYVGLSIAGSGEERNVDKVINEKRLSYVQKKDILQQALNGFVNIFIPNTKKLANLKENISKY